MKYCVVKSASIKEESFGSVLYKDLLYSDDYDDCSITKVTLNGEQRFGKNTLSDTMYYILDGKGTFYIEDEVIAVEMGDLVIIPKNTRYKDSGELTVLAISVPRFDIEKHIYEE